MTRPLFIAAVLLALALVACGGGGTNNGDGVWEYVATVCANGGCPTPAPWELPTATPNGRPTADATATAETLIRELPGNELKIALLASSIAMIEAFEAALKRANEHAEREGWLEQDAGFRPVTTPPEGSQWEIVVPAVYLGGAFCVANRDGEPDTYYGKILLMRAPKETP